jgi:hypothetical protein
MPPGQKRQKRTFEVKPAKRGRTPILIGLFGPSSSGKTYSALRLATGIQSVVGGDIVGIDTEARRMLHYADEFTFQHMEFGEPFGSLDYLDAFRHAVLELGAKTVIVDSMSHEHEGVGGMVSEHERIATLMATDRQSGKFDSAKYERVKMLAWNEPKQKRRALLNGILQLNANFIFCFRAKNTSKPQQVKVEGSNRTKNEVVQMGFMPIGGEDFVYEMTLAALLKPGAGGVPSWQSDQPGERQMIKLPGQFEFLRSEKFAGRALDETIGAALARWASGQAKERAEPKREDPPHQQQPEAEPAEEERVIHESNPGGEDSWTREAFNREDDNRPADDGTGYEGV